MAKKTVDQLKEELAQEKTKADEVAAMLARESEAADQAADPDSGVSVGVDYDFLNFDPNDAERLLRQAGKEDKWDPNRFHYRIINCRDKRMFDKRLAQGYEPLGVGEGDKMVARIDKEVKKRTIDRRVEMRKRAFEGSQSAQFDKTVKTQGGIPFDGHRSRRDGLD